MFGGKCFSLLNSTHSYWLVLLTEIAIGGMKKITNIHPTRRTGYNFLSEIVGWLGLSVFEEIDCMGNALVKKKKICELASSLPIFKSNGLKYDLEEEALPNRKEDR